MQGEVANVLKGRLLVGHAIMNDLKVLYRRPHLEKTCLRGFQPGWTLTGLYSKRRWLEARNFEFRQ